MKMLFSALAVSGLCLATAAEAANMPIGQVTTASKAFVARNGRMIPVSANMKLLAGDRLITRVHGSANVALNGKCKIALRASSMLPISATACAKPLIVKLDAGRAGYGNFSSAQAQGGAGAGAGSGAGAGAGAGAAGAGAGAAAGAAGAAAGGLGVAGAVAGVAAAAGAAAAASSGGGDNPTSP